MSILLAVAQCTPEREAITWPLAAIIIASCAAVAVMFWLAVK